MRNQIQHPRGRVYRWQGVRQAGHGVNRPAQAHNQPDGGYVNLPPPVFMHQPAPVNLGHQVPRGGRGIRFGQHTNNAALGMNVGPVNRHQNGNINLQHRGNQGHMGNVHA